MPFIDLVRSRYSCRAYKSDPVSREHIERMIEAARLAPSACNKQPWRFAVVRDEATRMRLVNESFLPGIPMRWAGDAPVIIALGMERSLVTHKLAPGLSGIEYPLLDVGIAGEHLVLQAAEQGLGTCWIGWIKSKKVREIVGWPRGIEAVSLITVGWPAATPVSASRLGAADIVKWVD